MIKKDFGMIKKIIEPFPSAIGPGDGGRRATGVDCGGQRRREGGLAGAGSARKCPSFINI